MTMPIQKPGRSKQDYGTPREFIDAVERRFGLLEWDLAAHAENTKCGEFFYGPGSRHGVDAFKIDWAARHPTGTLWLNPEFSDIAPWAERCADASARRHGLIAMLTPASVGTKWFVDHVHQKALVLALSPRMSFDGKDDYPKDLIVSLFGFGLRGFDVWRWK
jgi:phage N-6-adenine-methyltransferase